MKQYVALTALAGFIVVMVGLVFKENFVAYAFGVVIGIAYVFALLNEINRLQK